MKNSLLHLFLPSFIFGLSLAAGIALLISGSSAAGAVLCFIIAAVSLGIGLNYFGKVRAFIQYFENLIRRVNAGENDVEFPEEAGGLPLLADLGGALNRLLRRNEAMLETERKQKILQETVLTGLNEGIVLADSEGRILLETPTASKLLFGGGLHDERSRRKDTDMLSQYFYLRGVNARYVWQLMETALKDNEDSVHTLEFAGDEALRFVEVYVSPLRSEGSRGVLAVLRDVTHLKQLEQMRRDFVANVTHELKTPLTSISGYIDLLRARRRSPEEAEQFYTILDIEADRLENLISDLLELSEIEEGDRQRLRNEEVRLYSIGDEVLSELEPAAAEREVSLHLEVDPDFVFMANRHRIKQLIVNLMSNAVKYNKPGGKVVLSAERERGRIRISVRDTGIGIADEHIPRLFERFYRVSKSRSRELGGTGLGLAIVKHIAGLYGGSVQVVSEEGKGSVFTVILPDRKENGSKGA